MVAANPQVLVWARENAAIDVGTAAKRIGLRDSKEVTAVQKLALIESGARPPTRAQLHRMAKVYHQPLLSLYLNEPPAKVDRGHDFRSLPQKTADAEANARLDLLLRNVKTAQSLVRALLEDESAPTLPFVASAKPNTDAETLAENIVSSLNFNLQVFRQERTIDKSFAYLRKCLEEHGIFVLLLSDLGSWHSRIDASVFRGFALSDPIAPFIVITNQDAKTSWAFTAFHEVAHLWLGSTAISGGLSDELPSAIERLCNRVAGAVLLPSHELAKLASVSKLDLDGSIARIRSFAGERRLSSSMVAYSLLLSGVISRSQWITLKQRLDADWRAQEDARRENQRPSPSGPDSNVVRRRDLGPAIRNLVKRSMDAGALTPRKAGVILGVNPRRVEALVDS